MHRSPVGAAKVRGAPAAGRSVSAARRNRFPSSELRASSSQTHAPRSMPHAPRSMPHAPCPMPVGCALCRAPILWRQPFECSGLLPLWLGRGGNRAVCGPAWTDSGLGRMYGDKTAYAFSQERRSACAGLRYHSPRWERVFCPAQRSMGYGPCPTATRSGRTWPYELCVAFGVARDLPGWERGLFRGFETGASSVTAARESELSGGSVCF